MKSAKEPQPPHGHKDPIALMRTLGLPIVPGSEYLADTPLKKGIPSLEEVRRRLAKIGGSLSAEIRHMRDAS